MTRQKYGKKTRLTVTISPDLCARIQKLARGRRGGVSGVVEDCVKGHLDSLSKAPELLILDSAKSREEIEEIVKELLSPELVSEAMNIVRQKSEVGEEILKARSRRKGKASA